MYQLQCEVGFFGAWNHENDLNLFVERATSNVELHSVLIMGHKLWAQHGAARALSLPLQCTLLSVSRGENGGRALKCLGANSKRQGSALLYLTLCYHCVSLDAYSSIGCAFQLEQ